MRVISGSLKNRKINGFDLVGTRPTMDRVKESLFAIIQGRVRNSICLDLFSGSGNLGIEAISEGASHVFLADSNRKAVQVIQKNICEFGIESQCTVINLDYKKTLESLKNQKFDIIFLDPPYQTDYIEKSIELITKFDLLEEEGIIVCESDSINRVIYPKAYQVLRNKKYGDKFIVILEKVW